MTGDSAFLQALGWATLNSFWQMAILWCVFLLCNHLLRISSAKKYALAVSSIVFGFAWFVYTFCIFYNGSIHQPLSFFEEPFIKKSYLPSVLTAASVAYLLLLIFPVYKVFQNWQYLEKIKTKGLQKAQLCHRLFVQKTALQLGIRTTVRIYITHLISSPVTIGYLKPMILLPVAALNNLTVNQVEAILLHELSHIKRCDYLINLVLTLMHIILYFNPFIKLFMKAAEAERENCCDEMVLQFQYDKISYASALLTLEKATASTQLLMICAAEKKYLLQRIEKIVGVNRKSSFNFTNFAGAFVLMMIFFMINSVIIVGKNKPNSSSFVGYFSQPFSFFTSEEQPKNKQVIKALWQPVKTKISVAIGVPITKTTTEEAAIVPGDGAIEDDDFVPVAYDETDASLSEDQKKQVVNTVENTKKVLKTLQWQEVEKSIADAMTLKEKNIAKQEFIQEVERLDWKNIEKTLKSEYENVDWVSVNEKLGTALTQIKLDSAQKVYSKAVVHLQKTQNNCSSLLPIPDVSACQVQKAKEQLQKEIRKIDTLKTKKIVRL
ncbi:MAG: M56 family metallopeptidase [Chitinophagaceae bacterium]